MCVKSLVHCWDNFEQNAKNDLAGPQIIIKISLELFHKVPARAIETLFDNQNQPFFKRADLGK